MKTVYSTKEVKTVDKTTGELVSEEKTTFFKSVEPPFIKTYVDDLLAIINLPDRNKRVLLAILQYVDYDNYIDFTVRIKEEVAKSLKCSIGNVNNAISSLKKSGVLITKSRSTYILNPTYFCKGKWTNINKIRTTIEYSQNGKKIISNFELTKE